MPFPPKEIGMVYTPDEKNNMSLASQFSKYSPDIPFEMGFPADGICNSKKLLIVGIMAEKVKQNPEVRSSTCTQRKVTFMFTITSYFSVCSDHRQWKRTFSH